MFSKFRVTFMLLSTIIISACVKTTSIPAPVSPSTKLIKACSSLENQPIDFQAFGPSVKLAIETKGYQDCLRQDDGLGYFAELRLSTDQPEAVIRELQTLGIPEYKLLVVPASFKVSTISLVRMVGDFQNNCTAWSDLISHRPDMQVQEKVAAWNQFAQGPVIAPRFAAIERADGELINLDLYQVIVYRLPSHIESITKPSMLQIFHYMIDNINRFTPPGTNFYHYCSDVFGRSGKNPDCPSTNTKRSPQGKLGELVHIELSDDRYFLRKSIIHNDGSVMITQSNYSDSESSLIFTTMYTREDGTHPVSGNRQIGFSQVNPPSLMYRIYFRGADRPNASFKDKILYGGDQVWLSAQKKMTDLINANGGHAEIVKQERFYRPKWEDVREQCHKPDIAWDPQVVFEN